MDSLCRFCDQYGGLRWTEVDTTDIWCLVWLLTQNGHFLWVRVRWFRDSSFFFVAFTSDNQKF